MFSKRPNQTHVTLSATTAAQSEINPRSFTVVESKGPSVLNGVHKSDSKHVMSSALRLRAVEVLLFNPKFFRGASLRMTPPVRPQRCSQIQTPTCHEQSGNQRCATVYFERDKHSRRSNQTHVTLSPVTSAARRFISSVTCFRSGLTKPRHPERNDRGTE